MPIYILTYTKIMPGEPQGTIGDLFIDAFTLLTDAEKCFDETPLDQYYFRKELWEKTSDEKKKRFLKGERYAR